MKASFTIQDEIAIVDIIGKLTRESTDEINKCVQDILSKGTTKVLFNLAEVYYIDSLGLGMMFQIIRKLSLLKVNLAVCNVQESVLDVFEITGLKDHFEILSDLEEAKLYLLQQS